MRKGLHEIRTRVLCHLPVNDDQEERAFFEILGSVNELRHRSVGVHGYTHSEVRPPVFFGYWWPENTETPVRDQIVLCIIDYLLPPGSRELSTSVKELKQTIRRLYRYYRRPQEEVWGVVHPVIRQD